MVGVSMALGVCAAVGVCATVGVCAAAVTVIAKIGAITASGLVISLFITCSYLDHASAVSKKYSEVDFSYVIWLTHDAIKRMSSTMIYRTNGFVFESGCTGLASAGAG
jgi:hypothetical protein